MSAMLVGRRELGLRVASASVLAPLAVATAYLGGWLFAGFWALAALGVLWELSNLLGVSELTRVLNGAALLLGAALLASERWGWALGVLCLGPAAAFVVARAGQKSSAMASGWIAAALLGAPVGLRMDDELGFLAVALVFAIVWMTDITAYFVGRRMGGARLWPAISPNKTWSGAVGGTLGGLGAGVALAILTKLPDLLVIAVISAGLAVIAQVGDLMESALKRRLGAKDASHLIPGHGGLMDRLDSFLPTVLAALLLGVLHDPGSTPARGLLLW